MRREWKPGIAVFLLGGILTSAAWADEKIEMSTYIPAPGALTSNLDRLHAKRATIGPAYDPSLVPDSSVPDGSLFVSGNVGVGTAAPNEQLELTGNLRLPATTATAGIIRSGANTYIHSFGATNFFAGVNAGNLSMTGISNTGVGVNALSSNTGGGTNTAIGLYALFQNLEGSGNTATGSSALARNTSGLRNTATGDAALSLNTTGGYNTAIGRFALGRNTTGSLNTAVGSEAGVSINEDNANTTGSYNTFIGYQSGPGTSTPLTNATAIGYQAQVSASNALVLGGTGANAVKVGIGTTTPPSPLTVSGSTSGSLTNALVNVRNPNSAEWASVKFNNNNIADSQGAQIGVGGSGTIYTTYQQRAFFVSYASAAPGSKGMSFVLEGSASGAQDWRFVTDNQLTGTKVIITQAGSVGIGTTAPTQALHVVGNAYKTVGGTSWATSSDLRLKKNVSPMEGALEKMLKLRGVTFQWKQPQEHGNQAGPHMGLIGQEVERVFPEWVGTDSEGYKTIAPEGFEALTVEAIKQLKAENEALKKRMALFEKRLGDRGSGGF